jgi:CARDB protein
VSLLPLVYSARQTATVSTRDEDILDFDFFDEEEPPSWEDPDERRSGPPRGRGPRPPRRRFRAPGNLTPLLRLIALIGLAIVVVVLLAVWVEGCTSDRKRDRYSSYSAQIGQVGNASASLGEKLEETLTTPGLKQEDLDAKLGGYIQQAEAQMQKAQGLDPPGPLHDANEGAIDALELRVLGLSGLRSTFQDTADATDATEAGQQLATQAQRLLASDVVWVEMFRRPAESVLDDEGIEGVQIPTSEFVATDDLTTPSALAAVWQRIQGASTGGTPTGSHGSAISYVKALPSGTLLATTTEATILVTDKLAFEVGVEDSGDSQEVRIKVTLTIPKQPDPIVKTQTIPLIDPGETKAVTFTVGALVPFGEQIAIKVDVDPVQGETNTTNNSAEYPVIFTL